MKDRFVVNVFSTVCGESYHADAYNVLAAMPVVADAALLCVLVVHAQGSSSLKAALERQMLGPHSSYSARVLHRDANSGIMPSTLPPNQTAYRCMACDATCTSTAFPPGAYTGRM